MIRLNGMLTSMPKVMLKLHFPCCILSILSQSLKSQTFEVQKVGSQKLKRILLQEDVSGTFSLLEHFKV